MFRLFLEAYGYEVFTADNGGDGIELFREHRMPIVLTDIKMPGMDGIEVLQSIKEIDRAAEVIIITGHGDMDLAIRALSLDATDFINKPIRQGNLDAALKRAEERISQARDREEDYPVREVDLVAVLDIRGPVNANSEARLADAFARGRALSDRLVLSFSRDMSINGAGIALLTQYLLDCRNNGVEVALAGLPENYKNILDMVGIGALAPVHDTELLALKALTGDRA
jgi:CheY-like chemotaxis protein/anti-anti-sigma regulatory factor